MEDETIPLTKLTREELEGAVTFYRGKYEAALEIIELLNVEPPPQNYSIKLDGSVP